MANPTNKTPTTRPRCACGRTMGKSANRCKACHQGKAEALHAATRAIVAGGVCPDCGGKLKRNLSITGWWQCAQLGAEGFRADPTRPSCSWQGFTE